MYKYTIILRLFAVISQEWSYIQLHYNHTGHGRSVENANNYYDIEV